MMFKKLFVLVILLIAILPISYALTEVDSCQYLNTANELYVLNTSIINSTNSSCMIINATNITFECNELIIDGEDTTDYYAVEIETGMHNTTIRNCTFTEWHTPIYVNINSNEHLIEYNNITAHTSFGIDMYGGNDSIIRNNFIDGLRVGTWGYEPADIRSGVFRVNFSYNNCTHIGSAGLNFRTGSGDNIATNNRFINGSGGIRIDSNNTNATNNFFDELSTGITVNNSAYDVLIDLNTFNNTNTNDIYTTANTDFITVSNNVITNSGVSGANMAIYIRGNNSNVLNNNLTNTGWTGIYIYGDNFNVSNNRIISACQNSGGNSIDIFSTASSGHIGENYLIDCSNNLLYINGADDIVVNNNEFRYSNQSGIQLGSGTNDIIITNNHWDVLNWTNNENCINTEDSPTPPFDLYIAHNFLENTTQEGITISGNGTNRNVTLYNNTFLNFYNESALEIDSDIGITSGFNITNNYFTDIFRILSMTGVTNVIVDGIYVNGTGLGMTTSTVYNSTFKNFYINNSDYPPWEYLDFLTMQIGLVLQSSDNITIRDGTFADFNTGNYENSGIAMNLGTVNSNVLVDNVTFINCSSSVGTLNAVNVTLNNSYFDGIIPRDYAFWFDSGGGHQVLNSEFINSDGGFINTSNNDYFENITISNSSTWDFHNYNSNGTTFSELHLETANVSFPYISGDLTIKKDVSPSGEPETPLGQYLNITNSTNATANLTFHYTDSEIVNLTESSIRIFDWNSSIWSPLVSTVNETANTVNSEVTSFSIFAPLGTGDILISNCTNLNQSGATYRLTQNITNSSAQPCFNFQADNITLNCDGYLVDGINAPTRAVYINGYDDFTIRNCTFQDWTRGILLVDGDNGLIEHNTYLYSLGWGIFASTGTATNTTVQYENFNGGGDPQIQLETSGINDWTIQHSNFYGAGARLIFENSAHDILFYNNTVNRTATTSDIIELDDVYNINATDNTLFARQSAFWVYGGSYNITMDSNDISGDQTATGYGIRITNGDNNTFSNNNVTTHDRGVLILSGCENNLIDGNNITNTGNQGIAVDGSNNNLTNNLIYSVGTSGIYINSSATNVRIVGNNITDNRAGIEIMNNANNVFVINNSITDTSSGYGISGDGTSGLIIQGNNISDIKGTDRPAIEIKMNDTLIDNNRITDMNNSAIFIDGTNGAEQNHTLTNNYIFNTNGTHANNTQDVVFNNNEIHNNSGFGFEIQYSDNIEFLNNNITYTKGSYNKSLIHGSSDCPCGIYTWECENINVQNNYLLSNGYLNGTNVSGEVYYGANIYLQISNNSYVYNNTLIGETYRGIYAGGNYDNANNHTIVSNNLNETYHTLMEVHADSSNVSNNIVKNSLLAGLVYSKARHGFVINNTINNTYYGLAISNVANVSILNNKINDVFGTYNRFWSGDNVTYKDNTFNNITNRLYIYNVTNSLIESNIIDGVSGTTSPNGAGIHISTSENLTLLNNEIYNTNTSGIVLKTGTINNITIDGNIIENVTSGNGLTMDSVSGLVNIYDTEVTNTIWDFYSTNSADVNVFNLITVNTSSNFTYAGDIALRSADSLPVNSNLTDINKFLNITNLTPNSWIYIKIPYNYSEVGEPTTLRIYKNISGGWESCLGSNWSSTCGTDLFNYYTYANITNFSLFAPLWYSLPVTPFGTITLDCSRDKVVITCSMFAIDNTSVPLTDSRIPYTIKTLYGTTIGVGNFNLISAGTYVMEHELDLPYDEESLFVTVQRGNLTAIHPLTTYIDIEHAPEVNKQVKPDIIKPVAIAGTGIGALILLILLAL